MGTESMTAADYMVDLFSHLESNLEDYTQIEQQLDVYKDKGVSIVMDGITEAESSLYRTFDLISVMFGHTVQDEEHRRFMDKFDESHLQKVESFMYDAKSSMKDAVDKAEKLDLREKKGEFNFKGYTDVLSALKYMLDSVEYMYGLAQRSIDEYGL